MNDGALHDDREPPMRRVVVLNCPNCGGDVNTERAAHTEAVPQLRRWTGVSCSGCHKTYTIEEAGEP